MADLTRKRASVPARADVLAKGSSRGASRERVCVACGEVESLHIHPAQLAWYRDRERLGEGLVVAVHGIALRGSNCWECKATGGECLGHPWHHFVWRVAEKSGAPELPGKQDASRRGEGE